MTTIAYKSGVLAADGRMTRGNQLVTDNFPKIVDCEERSYSMQGEKVLAFALAGYLSEKAVLEYALGEGLLVTSSLDTPNTFSAIIVTERTAWFVAKAEEESPILDFVEIPDDCPWAIGSGGNVALHYLTSTACDPLDAVVQAMKTDTGSGGETMRWSKN